MTVNYKQEALVALDEAIATVDRIARGGALSPLEWVKLGSIMGYARKSIEQIQELKRSRKPKDTVQQ